MSIGTDDDEVVQAAVLPPGGAWVGVAVVVRGLVASGRFIDPSPLNSPVGAAPVIPVAELVRV